MFCSRMLIVVAMSQFAGLAQAASDATDRARPTEGVPAVPQKQATSPPRRSVPATVPETLAAPTTTTRAVTSRQSTPLPARPSSSEQPDRPATLTGCDAGGCWDSGGNRYNSGAGNTYMNNSGKLCTRNGPWMQCF